MRKHIITSVIFAVILLSLSGCMGLHHLSHTNQGVANHETSHYLLANNGASNPSGGCH